MEPTISQPIDQKPIANRPESSIPDEETLQNFISGRNQEWFNRQLMKLANYFIAAMAALLVQKGVDHPEADNIAAAIGSGVGLLLMVGFEMLYSHALHRNMMQPAFMLAQAAKKIAVALLIAAPLVLASCTSGPVAPTPQQQADIDAANRKLMARMFPILLLFLFPFFLISCSGFRYAEYDPATGNKVAEVEQISVMEDATSDAVSMETPKHGKFNRLVAGKNQQGVPKAGLTAWGVAKAVDGTTAVTQSNNAQKTASEGIASKTTLGQQKLTNEAAAHTENVGLAKEALKNGQPLPTPK